MLRKRPSIYHNIGSALLLFTLLFGTAIPARAANVLTVTCNPAQDSVVRPGDNITYSIEITKQGEQANWSAMRIQFGEGLQYDEQSVKVTFAPQPTPPMVTSEPLPTSSNPEWEVVPGNDGFVLLCSSLQDGCTLQFQATVREKSAALTMQATLNNTEGATDSQTQTHIASHMPDTIATPAPTPTPSASPPPAPQQGMSQEWRWVLFAGCALILYLIVQYILFQVRLYKRRSDLKNGTASHRETDKSV